MKDFYYVIIFLIKLLSHFLLKVFLKMNQILAMTENEFFFYTLNNRKFRIVEKIIGDACDD